MKDPQKPRTSKKAAAKSPTETPASPPDGQQASVTLRLYVAGQTPKSLTALTNLKRLCEDHLAARYKIELEVVDLMESPQRAIADQILAIPTLVRTLPAPIKKIIGDLSNTERVLLGLDVLVK